MSGPDYDFVKNKRKQLANVKDFDSNIYKKTVQMDKEIRDYAKSKYDATDPITFSKSKNLPERPHRNFKIAKDYLKNIESNTNAKVPFHKRRIDIKENIIENGDLMSTPEFKYGMRPNLEKQFILKKKDADVPVKFPINPKYHGLSNVGENFYNSQNRKNEPYQKTLRNRNNLADHNDILSITPDKPLTKEQLEKRNAVLNQEKGRLFGSYSLTESNIEKAKIGMAKFKEEKCRIFGI